MTMLKIILVAGAMPNFMKIAPVLRVLRRDYSDRIAPLLVHTGQHYDRNMSGSFFDELDIPRQDYNLECVLRQSQPAGRGHHGQV